jgi:broad specificity phosphatase PhoE
MSAPPADKINPVAFWFLRHGETDWNAQDLSQGSVDIPLNETGLAQARSAALLLRNRGIRSLISSPLSRARVTAEIAAAELGLPVYFDDGLREVSFGVQEGKPMAAWGDGALRTQTDPGAAVAQALATAEAFLCVIVTAWSTESINICL